LSGDGLSREKFRRERGRERECVAVLSGGELDGGRRATMWVSPQYIYNLLNYVQTKNMLCTLDC